MKSYTEHNRRGEQGLDQGWKIKLKLAGAPLICGPVRGPTTIDDRACVARDGAKEARVSGFSHAKLAQYDCVDGRLGGCTLHAPAGLGLGR